MTKRWQKGNPQDVPESGPEKGVVVQTEGSEALEGGIEHVLRKNKTAHLWKKGRRQMSVREGSFMAKKNRQSGTVA